MPVQATPGLWDIARDKTVNGANWLANGTKKIASNANETVRNVCGAVRDFFVNSYHRVGAGLTWAKDTFVGGLRATRDAVANSSRETRIGVGVGLAVGAALTLLFTNCMKASEPADVEFGRRPAARAGAGAASGDNRLPQSLRQRSPAAGGAAAPGGAELGDEDSRV